MGIVSHYRDKTVAEFYRNESVFLISVFLTAVAILIYILESAAGEFSILFATVNIIIAIFFLMEIIFEFLVLKPRRHIPLVLWSYFRDIIVIISLLPIFISTLTPFISSFIFLRLLKLYTQYKFYLHHRIMRYEEVITNTINLAVFLFVAAGLIFAFEAPFNAAVNSYFDAFYFTVSTVSTTGYGDIIPQTAVGRIFGTMMMLVGITLFLKLASSFSRERKLNKECQNCGLTTHDINSVYCRRCGVAIDSRASKAMSQSK